MILYFIALYTICFRFVTIFYKIIINFFLYFCFLRRMRADAILPAKDMTAAVM